MKTCFPKQVFQIARGLLLCAFLCLNEHVPQASRFSPPRPALPLPHPNSLGQWNSVIRGRLTRWKAMIIECKQFCFHDCKEGEEWRNNLETLKMGRENGNRRLQENRHPSLKKYIFYFPNLWRKAHFIFFSVKKWGKKHVCHFLFLQG